MDESQKNISRELTKEERHHGVRSHKQNPAIPMEKRRGLEFDLEYEIGRDVLRIFQDTTFLKNPGRQLQKVRRNNFSNFLEKKLVKL